MIRIATLQFNPFGENTYVLYGDNRECIIVDAGCCTSKERQALTAFVENNGLTPKMALCTHGHVDHVCGVQYIKDKYGIPFALHRLDIPLLEMTPMLGQEYGFAVNAVPEVEIDLAGIEHVALGDDQIEIIHTPGHSPGHVAVFLPGEDMLLSGDLLFKGSIGRTDLPGGSYPVIMESIIDKIIPLPGSTQILPGHGPSTQLSHEIMFNPFISEALNGEINFRTNEN